MRSSQIQAYGNYVLIKVDERETQIGSIVLPGEELGIEIVGNKTGRVLSVGKGRYERRELGQSVREGVFYKDLQKMIPVGSRVVFRGYIKDCQPVDTDDEGEYAFLHVGDLLGFASDDLVVGEWGRIQLEGKAS